MRLKIKSHFLLRNSEQFSVKMVCPCIWDPGCSQISTLPSLTSAKMEENRQRGPLRELHRSLSSTLDQK